MNNQSCSQCGAERKEGMFFCPECGSAFPETAVTDKPDETPMLTEPPVIMEASALTETSAPVPMPMPAEAPAGTDKPFTPLTISDNLAAVAETGVYAPDNSGNPDNAAANVAADININVDAAQLNRSAPVNAGRRKITAASVLAAIASVFLCVLTVLTVSAAQLNFIARGSLKKEVVQDAVRGINISDFTPNVINNITANINRNITIRGYSETIPELLYELIPEYYRVTYKDTLSAQSIAELLESEELRDFVAGKAVLGADYILGRETADEIITTEEIMALIKDNEALIESKTGYKMTDADYADIRREVDKSVLTWRTVGLDNVGAASFINKGVSLWAFIGLCAVTAVFAALIVLLNLKRNSIGLVYIGSAFAFSGFSTFIFMFYISTVLSITAGVIGINRGALKNLFGASEKLMLYSGAAVMISGVVLITAGIITAKIRKSVRCRNPEAQNLV